MDLIGFLKKVGVDLKSWQVKLLERYFSRDANAQRSVQRTPLKDGGKTPEFIIFDDIHVGATTYRASHPKRKHSPD
jgi:hypothetical protein